MGKHILVIDDTPDIREAIGELLEDAGFKTAMVGDGRAALEALQAPTLPDLILLDLMMPVMNGFEFRKNQLADPRLAEIPTVIMTAIHSFDEAPLRLKHILIKPFDRAKLLATIESALDDRVAA